MRKTRSGVQYRVQRERSKGCTARTRAALRSVDDRLSEPRLEPVARGHGAAVTLVAVVIATQGGIAIQHRGESVPRRGERERPRAHGERFTRTHRLRWVDVATVSVEDSGNVTGRGACIAIRLTNRRRILARGCSSYSRPKLERIAQAIADERPHGKGSGAA